MIAAAMRTVRLDVPVDPGAEDAAELLLIELSKPPYQAAKPTLFDLIANGIRDWFESLDLGSAAGPPGFGIAVILVLIVVGVVVAFLIFGVPRINRRSTMAGSLFGEDDARSAARIREAAESAAARGDYSAAVTEMFRAIARGLGERTFVSTSPGTTARDFAARAGRVFPPLADRLADCALSFDDVRYLGRDGTVLQYDGIAALERDLRAARPAFETVS